MDDKTFRAALLFRASLLFVDVIGLILPFFDVTDSAALLTDSAFRALFDADVAGIKTVPCGDIAGFKALPVANMIKLLML